MAARFLLPTLVGFCLTAAFAQPDSVRWNEFKPALMTDFGHVVKGDYGGNELEFLPVNRNIVILEQSALYGDWTFDGGFKAIVWWPFPPTNAPESRTIRVEPRLSVARARYAFSAPAYVEFGFFPYKYNPDAQNLGEYLYRSGTYPGVLRTTDGFQLMNYAAYEAYGAHFHASQFGGRLKHEVNLFSEPTIVPIGDLTPAYEASLDLPLFQFGVGAAFNRLIAYHPSRNRPKDPQNAYYEVDSANGGGLEFAGPYGLLPEGSTVKARIDARDSTVRRTYYFTQRGVKLMARAAVDLGALLLPEHLRSPGDLRVFAEVALLGLKNQPYFYDDRAERAPVMFGVNVPTLRLLDRLSVQTEYYRSPFSSSYNYDYYSFPSWKVLPADTAGGHRDDWKWSVNASKRLNRLLTVHAQVANDHMRLPNFNLNPTEADLTKNPSEWYYLLRLECRL
jgi:hypothetical protein